MLHIDFWAAQFRWLVFFSVIHQVIEDLVITYLPLIVHLYTNTNDVRHGKLNILHCHCHSEWGNKATISIRCRTLCRGDSRLLKWSPCIPACLVAYFGQCSSVHAVLTVLYKLHCVIAIILRGIYFGIYISLFDGQPKLIRVLKGSWKDLDLGGMGRLSEY